MADQNDTQSPPQAQPVVPAAPSNAAIEVVKTGFVATVKDLWSKYSIFFIIFGALILIAKFNDLISDILGLASKKDVADATKTDEQLKAKETAANDQANALIKQANELPSKEGVVDADWNKKK